MDPLFLAARAGFPAVEAHVLAERPGRLVARLTPPVGDPLVLKADRAPGSFAPEVAAVERLAAAGLPVPEVLTYRTVDGPEVLVLSWIEGEPLSAAASPAAQAEAGRLLHKVHAIPAGPPFSGQPTVAAWIADWLEQLVAWWPDRERGELLRRRHRQLQPLLVERRRRMAHPVWAAGTSGSSGQAGDSGSRWVVSQARHSSR